MRVIEKVSCIVDVDVEEIRAQTIVSMSVLDTQITIVNYVSRTDMETIVLARISSTSTSTIHDTFSITRPTL